MKRECCDLLNNWFSKKSATVPAAVIPVEKFSSLVFVIYATVYGWEGVKNWDKSEDLPLYP